MEDSWYCPKCYARRCAQRKTCFKCNTERDPNFCPKYHYHGRWSGARVAQMKRCNRCLVYRDYETISENLCEICRDSRKETIPYGYSNSEDWSKKMKKCEPATIQDIPMDVFIENILPLLLRLHPNLRGRPAQVGCADTGWGDVIPVSYYLKAVYRCIRVSKEWRDYFNCSQLWKHMFLNTKVHCFYEKRMNQLTTIKNKNIMSTGWSKTEINQNKCKMIILNETRGIPYDIYWLQKKESTREPGTYKFMHTMKPNDDIYICNRTYPNAIWMCIPTEQWLNENPYSTVGFTFVIDLCKLEDYEYTNKEGKLVCRPAYVARNQRIRLFKNESNQGYKQRISELSEKDCTASL